MPRYPERTRTKKPPNYQGWFKTTNSGYYIHAPYHPYATKAGYVLEHRLICESVMGRHLKPDEHVHHVNEIKTDNRHSNLVVCQGNGYHRLLHKRKKALLACGHANWLMCRYCSHYAAPENMVVRHRYNETGIRAWHVECLRVHSNNRYRNKVKQNV